MKKKHILTIGIPVFALLVLTIWRISSGTSATAGKKASVPIVRVQVPFRQTVAYELQFTGDVAAMQQATLIAKVGGSLERVLVDMGKEVQNGQTLAVIDSTELFQQVQQAAATFFNARINYQRSKDLLEKKLIAQQELDNNDALMKVAQASYEIARIRLGYARLAAPFAGIITKRYLDAGAAVTANVTPLFTLMDLRTVRVFINVLEKDIPLVNQGKVATVTVDAFPDKTFTGSVTRLSQAVDPATRTMPVEIQMDNRDQLLKPGMFCSVSLAMKQHENALTVPTQAIMKDGKGLHVFVLNGTAVRRVAIVPGLERDGLTEILTGLTGGESVVTTGQQYVREGVTVTVQL